MKVANVVSNTVFWIDNVFGAPPIYQDGTDQDAYVVSKITVPEFKLTDIYFDFGNSSPLVSISAVATDAWLAQVAANQYSGKLSLTENDINASIINDHDNNQLLVKDAAPLGIVHRPTNSKAHRLDESFVPISLAKLYSKYRQSNPTGLEAKSPFKIVFPTKVYSLLRKDSSMLTRLLLRTHGTQVQISQTLHQCRIPSSGWVST
jgi:hypothetical protein